MATRGVAPLHPDRAVEAAVLQRLEEVVLADALGLSQVHDAAGDLENAVMDPRTEMEILHGMFEQSVAAGGDLAELAHVARLQARIQRRSQSFAEPHSLTCVDLFNSRPDRRGTFFGRTRGEFVIVDRRRCHVDINAIKQRPRDTLTIALDGALRTSALTLRVPVIATWRQLHNFGCKFPP